jgi:hypothetical protein
MTAPLTTIGLAARPGKRAGLEHRPRVRQQRASQMMPLHSPRGLGTCTGMLGLLGYGRLALSTPRAGIARAVVVIPFEP